MHSDRDGGETQFNSGKRVLYSAVGGSLDPEKNAMLATTLKKAREQGVPKDNIEKALANVKSSWPSTSEVSFDEWCLCCSAHEVKSTRENGWYMRRLLSSRLGLSCKSCALPSPSRIVVDLFYRECVTDNINRTIHNVREILTSHGFVAFLLKIFRFEGR